MYKVCLLIIYNHRYDDNIEKLENIYSERFSHIMHIIPFYNGTRENVIPVYECSFRFQGYIAQAWARFQGDYEQYLFIADDMILNPEINEGNYQKYFHVKNEEAFLTWTKPIGDLGGWGFGRRFMDPLPVFEWYNGTHWKDEIMQAEKAFEIAETKGFSRENFTIPLRIIWNNRRNIRKYPRLFVLFFKILLLGAQQCQYPVWGGYSDVIIVPGKKMKEIAHMLGVFAGMNLHVEMAIPTAINLICEKVKEQNDIEGEIKLIWNMEEKQNMVKKYNGNYHKLVEAWDKKWVLIHPVKLSQWDV